MAKRFSDGEIWKKKWYCDLSPALKCFWKYICDMCDNAGVWEMNIPLAEYQIGAKIAEDEILSQFNGNIIKISDSKMFVVDFIKFQYGELNRDSIPHRNIFRLLEKHSLSYPINTLSIGYRNVPDTLKDKDKDKEEDKDKEKEEEEVQEKPKTWRDDFTIYESESLEAIQKIMADDAWIAERQQYHPRLNILLSLKKAYNDFWGSEAGWAHKKRSKAKTIDWYATMANALTMKGNQVWQEYQK